jgi:hypothetical protein
MPDGRHLPLLLYGIVCICIGLGCYRLGVAMAVPRYLFGRNRLLLPINEWIVHTGPEILFETAPWSPDTLIPTRK